MSIQRIRIETGSKATVGTGGSAWTRQSYIIRWAEAVLISVQARERYQSLDREVNYKFKFRGRPGITMQGTRFVWMTDGHPNKLKIYVPVASAGNSDGVGRFTSVLVNDTGEVESS